MDGYHGVRAYHNTTLSLASSTAMSFNAEDWDTDGYHDTVTNNSRLIVPAGKGLAGYYQVRGFLYWDNGSSRDVYLRQNGTPVRGTLVWAGGGGDEVALQMLLADNDYVDMIHGGATVTVGHASVAWAMCTLEMYWLGPA